MHLNSNECPTNYECYFDGTAYGCCPTAESICTQRADEGKSCDQPTSLRWFFDDASNTCRSFLFRGCGGNANNFPVQQMCMEYCSRPELLCPSGGVVHRHSNGEIAECQSSAQCPSEHECLKSVLQTGGEVRYCCPSQQHICKQQPDIGDDCGQSVLR
ncbi:Kunitz/Bovine pancreatic trypsin inhibitor domain protein [Cooperia oncophora]